MLNLLLTEGFSYLYSSVPRESPGCTVWYICPCFHLSCVPTESATWEAIYIMKYMVLQERHLTRVWSTYGPWGLRHQSNSKKQNKIKQKGLTLPARPSKENRACSEGKGEVRCRIVGTKAWSTGSKTLRLSFSLHTGVKAKTALTDLNRQGQFYLRLFQ